MREVFDIWTTIDYAVGPSPLLVKDDGSPVKELIVFDEPPIAITTHIDIGVVKTDFVKQIETTITVGDVDE